MANKLNYVWNYLSTTLDNFKVKLLGYRSYVAVITQANTDVPTAVVLQNNIGPATLAYNSTGIYFLNFIPDIFTPNNTIAIASCINDANDAARFVWANYSASNQIAITVSDSTFTRVNDNVINLEIRVYN